MDYERHPQRRGVPGWTAGTAHLAGVRRKSPIVPEKAYAAHRYNITVRGQSLASIIASTPLPEYDWVQIDVEGFDQDVLAQLVPMKWRPRVICLEECGPRSICMQFFTANAYTVLEFPDQTCGHTLRLDGAGHGGCMEAR